MLDQMYVPDVKVTWNYPNK